jgi:hypothetical protein
MWIFSANLAKAIPILSTSALVLGSIAIPLLVQEFHDSK